MVCDSCLISWRSLRRSQIPCLRHLSRLRHGARRLVFTLWFDLIFMFGHQGQLEHVSVEVYSSCSCDPRSLTCCQAENDVEVIAVPDDATSLHYGCFVYSNCAMLLMALGTRQEAGAGSSSDRAKPVACKAMPRKRVDTPGFHL